MEESNSVGTSSINTPQSSSHGHHKAPGRRTFILIIITGLIIVGILSGFLGGWIAQDKDSSTTVEKQQIVLQNQGELISHIAKSVGSSVVSVETTAQVTTDVFGFGRSSELRGAGTGIILTAEGLIVTNRHVVPSGTTDIKVTLSDGTEYDNVEVVGRTGDNDSLDVAFLKVTDTKGKKLTPAALGDSSKMQIGESVVAIGNALGQFQNTVTTGVISGYGRSVEAFDDSGANGENLENLFQTDAAINSGNSGGPLTNLKGEVIGINTAVASGGAQNISFAIPINDVSGLIESVKKTGKLERPFLGIVYIPLTNDTADLYGLSEKRGAYVPSTAIAGTDSVIDNGPADKAGIKEGDVIIKIDGVSIDQNNSLSAVINRHKVGDKVTLVVKRNNKQQSLTAVLAAAPTN